VAACGTGGGQWTPGGIGDQYPGRRPAEVGAYDEPGHRSDTAATFTLQRGTGR
jgi:hypothetical protein